MSYPNQDDENNASQEKDSQLKAQKEMMLKQVLSSDARLRLNNVRMVKPELADLVENYILNLSVQGKISGQISDEQLKQIEYSQIRNIFLQDDIIEVDKIEFKDTDYSGIIDYLSNERDFSRERIQSSLNRLKHNLEKRSHTLEQWF